MCLIWATLATGSRARMFVEITDEACAAGSGPAIELCIDGPPGAPEQAANATTTSANRTMTGRYHAPEPIRKPANIDRDEQEHGREAHHRRPRGLARRADRRRRPRISGHAEAGRR